MSLHWMAVCLMLFMFVGIVVFGPGLVGLMNDVDDRVEYTVGDTVSASNLSLPRLSTVFIDSALEEIW